MVTYYALTAIDTDAGHVRPGEEIDVDGWDDERLGRALRSGEIRPVAGEVVSALPVGPAGGDLAGVYPDPRLRAQSVGDTHIDPADPIGRDRIAGAEPVSVVGEVGKPAFLGTFTNHGGGFEAVGYWLDAATGLVHLRGLATSTGTDDQLFRLPQGYRPITGHVLVPTTGRTGGALVVVTVHDTGLVTVTPGGPHAAVSLSGISFRVGS